MRSLMEKLKRYMSLLFKKVDTLFVAAKSKAAEIILSRNPYYYFVTLMLVSLLIFGVSVMILGHEQLMSIFFRKGADLGMDFFNSIRDVSHDYKYLYEEVNVIYPPLANLIFLVFSKIIPSEYTLTEFSGRYTWMNYPTAIFSFVSFFLLIIVAYTTVFPKLVKTRKPIKPLFILFLIMNVPVLYSIERGNIVAFSNLLTIIYLVTYDSDNKFRSEVGLICLAASFALKLYPAIFGWFLIVDKQYKKAARLILYAIVLYVIPSFFFGGPVYCAAQLFKNIFSFSSSTNQSSSNLFTPISSNLYNHRIINGTIYNAINFITPKLFKLLSLISVLSMIIAPFLIKSQCLRTVIFCTAMASVSSIGSVYFWVTLIAALIIMFRENEKLEGQNWLLFFAIVLPFMFFPKPTGIALQTTTTINEVLMNICHFVLMIYVIIITAKAVLSFIATKRKKQ